MNEVFISYVQGDQSIIKGLASRLEAYDIKLTDISSTIKPGISLFQAIKEVVSNQRYFITLISDNYIKSGYNFAQYNEVIQQALRRDKTVILIIPEKLKDHEDAEYFLNNCTRVFFAEERFNPDTLIHLAKDIKNTIRQVEYKQYLFERLAELKKFDQTNKISETLNELVYLLLKELDVTLNTAKRRTIIKQIVLCLSELSENNEYDFSPKSQRSTTNRMHALKAIDKLYETPEFNSNDLFFLALQIYLKYVEEKIQAYCKFIISQGEVVKTPQKDLKEYMDFQYKILDKFIEEKLRQNVSYLNPSHYSDNEIHLILNVKDFLISNRYYDQVITLKEKTSKKGGRLTAPELHDVAVAILETNKLLETLVEQRNTQSVLKALRTRYNRLRTFAELIGATDICLKCIDEIARINSELENSSKQILKDDRFTKAVKSLLGLTISDMGKFDVFICHADADADIAYNIYNYLKSYLKNPFLDTMHLPELFPSELRQSKMTAIQNSANFVVVASDITHLSDKRVEVEMNSFHYKMVLEKGNNAHFLIVVTEDVYDQIMSSNKIVLDSKFRDYEIIKISSSSDYKDQILGFLN